MKPITWKDIRREIRLIIQGSGKTRLYGITGWPDKTLGVANKPNLLKVTLIQDSREIVAVNENIPFYAGIQVEIYEDGDYPGLFWARRAIIPVGSDFGFISGKFHRHNHAWLSVDPIFVDVRQLLPLRPSASGFVVSIYPGWVLTEHGYKYYVGGSITVNEYIPVLGSRYILISINWLLEIIVTVGDIKSVLDLSLADLPPKPPNITDICGVRLFAGQTRIKDNIATPDITDLRFSPSPSGIYEAPNDGRQYARQNKSWNTVSSGGSSGGSGGNSIDIRPSQPSPYDEEFDSSFDINDWTVIGTLGTCTASDVPDLLHVVCESTGVMSLHGLLKPVPTLPFTVTMKLLTQGIPTNHLACRFLLSNADKTKFMDCGNPLHSGGFTNIGYGIWSSRTSRAGYSDKGSGGYPSGPWYSRLVVSASGKVSIYVSSVGLIWDKTWTDIDPGFVVDSIGIGLSGHDYSVRAEAYFDWMRFT